MRINRYTGRDEDVARLHRSLERERQKVRFLGTVLAVLIGMVVYHLLPSLPFRVQVVSRGVCLELDRVVRSG